MVSLAAGTEIEGLASVAAGLLASTGNRLGLGVSGATREWAGTLVPGDASKAAAAFRARCLEASRWGISEIGADTVSKRGKRTAVFVDAIAAAPVTPSAALGLGCRLVVLVKFNLLYLVAPLTRGGIDKGTGLSRALWV